MVRDVVLQSEAGQLDGPEVDRCGRHSHGGGLGLNARANSLHKALGLLGQLG